MRVRTLTVALVMGLGLQLVAQSSAVSPEIARGLRSNRWQVRRDAFERVAGRTNATTDAAMQNALVQLMRREDIDSETNATDLYEDDDYVAYHDQLLSLVQKIATTTNDPQAWRALVYDRYSGDSPLGQWLARHKAALPLIVGQLKSRYSVRRMTAVQVVSLRLIYSKSAKPDSGSYVSPRQYRYLKARIRFLAKTDVAPVSQAACMGLGAIGDKGDIPLLEQVAADPTRDKYTQKFAHQAVEQIRGDTHTVDRLRTQNSFK